MKKMLEEMLAEKKTFEEVLAALTAETWVPISFIAELQQEEPRAIREHAKRDPDFPPLLSLSTFARAKKFVRWGDFVAYRAKREALAKERKAARIARNAELAEHA